jgi:F0F1-type ATP synthase assembly protein I
MSRLTLRIAALQAVLAGVSGAGAFALGGKTAAWSAMAGGTVAVLATLVMAYRERQSASRGDWSAQRHLVQFYRSGFERLLIVLVLLGVLFSLPDATPLAVLAGFICAQMVWLVACWIN